MKEATPGTGKIIGINVALHLIGVVLINLIGRLLGGHEAALTVGTMIIMITALQVVANVVLGFAFLLRKKTGPAQGVFLSVLVLLVVGFSTCSMSISIDGY